MAEARGEIQVSPEELRFLRRFFLIQALPWILVVGALAIAAARWTAPAAVGAAALEKKLADATSALDAVRQDNAALRSALDAEAKRMQAALERVGAVEGRVAVVEKRGAGAGRADGDLDARVARLEARGAGEAGSGDALARSALNRVRELEARVSGLEGPSDGSVPAAPQP